MSAADDLLRPLPRVFAFPVSPETRDAIASDLETLLRHASPLHRESGRAVLAASLGICRYPADHLLASGVRSGGLYRIDLDEAARIIRDVPAAFASSDPQRHAAARAILADALGASMMDEA
jgi:hypothetical protein